MEVRTGRELADELRRVCDGVERRLWIAAPFVGDWWAVRRILGRRWLDNVDVGVRVITDTSDGGSLNRETIRRLRGRGGMKHVRGLHAKIYIVDDCAVVSSANLTRTAFAKRYEVGVFLTGAEAGSVIGLYDEWWEDVAEEVAPSWRPRRSRRRGGGEGEGLEDRWELPGDPGDPGEGSALTFLDYEGFLRAYHDFANEYARGRRVWQDAPLYFETDSFLNYLFHEAPRTPSKRYAGGQPRRLSEQRRREEIRRYASRFREWISEGGDDRWREDTSRVFRGLLSRNNVGRLRRRDVEEIAGRLQCLKAMRIRRVQFLNPRNNRIDTIRGAWEKLIYGEGVLHVRMGYCKDSLYAFGKSSVQELLGFFDPTSYPIRNTNSNAGLRFLGYDVPAY